MIPFKLFALLLHELPAIESARELQLIRATALGVALFWEGEKNSAVKFAIRDLSRRAFPEIQDLPPQAS